MTDEVFLVPDLDAYEYLYPGLAPGVAQGVVMPGWELISSFFSHRMSEPAVEVRHCSGLCTELYFNIDVRRNFWDASVTCLVPLIVVASMLFATVLTFGDGRDVGRNELMGFNVMGALAAVSGLFFVVLLSHIQLRREIPGAGTMYIELFFFAMYVMLLLASVYAFFITHSSKYDRKSGGDIDWFCLLYWPILSGMLLISTIPYLLPSRGPLPAHEPVARTANG